MRNISTVLLLAAAPSVAIAGELTTNVDFESGLLGWSGPAGPGGGSNIVPNGGNGGGAGYQTVFNNFGITYTNSTNPAIVGDYGQFDSVTLSIDVLVNDISFFGSPAPRPWLVELRDFDTAQGGYPWTSVWFLFDNISAGPDWTTYSVTIDDPTSTTLPVGWNGYGDDDPVTFEPILPAGVTFADVLSGVDEVAFTTLQPGFFFGFTDFDVVLDNISITTDGGAWCSIPGGLSGTNGVPQLIGYGDLSSGSQATVALFNGAPSAPAFLGVGTSQVSIPLLGGTLLTSADIAIVPATTNGAGFLPLNFTWPNSLPAGVNFYWQQWVLDGMSPEGVIPSTGLESTTP